MPRLVTCVVALTAAWPPPLRDTCFTPARCATGPRPLFASFAGCCWCSGAWWCLASRRKTTTAAAARKPAGQGERGGFLKIHTSRRGPLADRAGRPPLPPGRSRGVRWQRGASWRRWGHALPYPLFPMRQHLPKRGPLDRQRTTGAWAHVSVTGRPRRSAVSWVRAARGIYRGRLPSSPLSLPLPNSPASNPPGSEIETPSQIRSSRRALHHGPRVWLLAALNLPFRGPSERERGRVSTRARLRQRQLQP